MEHVAKTKRLHKRAKATVERAQSTLLRTRALAIRTAQVKQAVQDTLYANHQIRGVKR